MMRVFRFYILTVLILCQPPLFSVQAYRIEVEHEAVAGGAVFLAGYYGDRLAVIDSAMADAGGRAVLAQQHGLCPGLYTLVAPGKLMCDLLIDGAQRLHVKQHDTAGYEVVGDEQAAAYAAYRNHADTIQDREQLTHARRQLIERYPHTLLAAFLTALQPVAPSGEEAGNLQDMMQMYRYRRLHFFDNMPLSDARLLHTPLYHERLDYFMKQFVTQHTDSLIHIAFRLLEQAAGHHETFFYVSDYLINFSLLNKIEGIARLHNFVLRNRDVLGSKGVARLPAGARYNYFKLANERALQQFVQAMPLTDVDGQVFDTQTVRNRYRVYYFWKNDCLRCLADAARWQSVLARYAQRAYVGLAVNVQRDVQRQDCRILAYDPLCVNLSASALPWCSTVFFADLYSKLLVTDADGHVLGIFASPASLDQFLRFVI